MTVYDAGELKALKDSMHASPERELRRQIAPKPQDAVGFRLDPYYVGRLAEDGAKLGMSPGDYARRLVIRSLEEPASERHAEELRALKNGIAGMFYLILVQKFGASQEEANQIVARVAG